MHVPDDTSGAVQIMVKGQRIHWNVGENLLHRLGGTCRGRIGGQMQSQQGCATCHGHICLMMPWVLCRLW